jgi:ribosomal protein S18 acetylase RimI-like enzyme
MQIERVTEATDELLQALRRLIPQLTQNNPPPSHADLKALVASESSELFIARDETGRIAGAGNVSIYRVATGVRAIIEDVIVDQTARGQGIGEALVQHLLEEARGRGAPAVTLTSNPKREAANRLYQRMGFVRRETNAYVYRFK